MILKSCIMVGALLVPTAAMARESACFASPIAAIGWPVNKPFRAKSRFRTPLIDRHEGIDIGVAAGTEVRAVAGGLIIWAGPDPDGANIVALRLHGGRTVRYGHLSRVDVAKGIRVKRGHALGLTGGEKGAPGSGPYTTGPHLHLDVHDGKAFIDPMPLFCKKAAP